MITTTQKRQSETVDGILKTIRHFHKTEKKEFPDVFHDDETGKDISVYRITRVEVNWNDKARKEQDKLVRKLDSGKKELSCDELFKIHSVLSKYHIDTFCFLKELDSRNDPRGAYALYEVFSGSYKFGRHRNLNTSKKYLKKAADLGFPKAQQALEKFGQSKPCLIRKDLWLEKGPSEDDIVASIGGLIAQMSQGNKKLPISELLGKMEDQHVDYDGYVDSFEWEGDKLHLSVKASKTTIDSLNSYFLVVEEFGGKLGGEV